MISVYSVKKSVQLSSRKHFCVPVHLFLLLQLIFSSASKSISSRSIEILPYENVYAGAAIEKYTGSLPLSYLSGFHPFRKYNTLLFLKRSGRAEIKDNNESSDRLSVNELKHVIASIFHSTEYFYHLKNAWKSKRSLQIYASQIENFITMVKMANEPYHAQKEALVLSLEDINEILALFEIFSMSDQERITRKEAIKAQMGISKRQCFRENLRLLIQQNPSVSATYAYLLRKIRANKRHTLLAEIPREPISSVKWVFWSLLRPKNKDIFWYLFSTIYYKSAYTARKNIIVAYVKESFIFGKKGISIYISNSEVFPPYAVSLSEFLKYRKPNTVKQIEIRIQEELIVPELYFSSVIEIFSAAEIIIMQSLGNTHSVRGNLSLINIILDYEEKRKEAKEFSVLKGLIIRDFNSINNFAKSQLMGLPMKAVGYFQRMERSVCCIKSTCPCLYSLDNREPTFLGKFSISVQNIGNIKQLVAPYDVFFEENISLLLPAVEEIDISVFEPEISSTGKNVYLPFSLKNSKSIKCVRILGASTKFYPSYFDVFSKILQMQNLSEIDISSISIGSEHIITELLRTSHSFRASVQTFSFRYVETEISTAYAHNIDAGVPSLLESIINIFPRLVSLNVYIDNTASAVYNLVRDIKYLLGCHKKESASILLNILHIKFTVPLSISMKNSCNTVTSLVLQDMLTAIHSTFDFSVKCPNGFSSKNLVKMTIQEYMVKLKEILQKDLCSNSA